MHDEVDIEIALNWLASKQPLGLPTDGYPEHIRAILDGLVTSWGSSRSQDGSRSAWVELIEVDEHLSPLRRWKRIYKDHKVKTP
jgi:hypothetical protein